MRRRGERGQASIELLAMVPLVILAALLAWQLTAVLAAGLEAQERVRSRALRAEGGAATVRVVSVSVAVPRVLPGAGGLRLTARAGVRAP